jgi:hypothetical protein
MARPIVGFTRWRIALQWRLAGRPVPAPHIVKQRVLMQYQKRYGLRTLVETGTFTGEMVHAMSRRFDRIHSIELSRPLYDAAVSRFAGRPHVCVHFGDSGSVLPGLLPELHEPALFWLDGHFMGGATGRGSLDTPISDELTAILRHGVRGHVVLVDDARLFDGTAGYPALPELCARIARERPNARIEVADDIIRCVFDAVS